MLEENIASLFNSYFEIILAHTGELKKECFKIRYEVYCEELKFEDASSFNEPLETDETDQYSHHYLIKHKSTGMYAGTIRLVDPSVVGGSKMCPIEQYCLESITDRDFHPSKLQKGSYCEVSRLAVPSFFRRRSGERGKPFIYEGDRISIDDNEKKAFPFIAVGLYLCGAAHFIAEEQLSHIFVMMEPRLALHLRRVGIGFKQIGDIIEYHGQRAAFHVNEERLLSNMRPNIRELYDLIFTHVAKQLKAHTNLKLIDKVASF